jgi:glycosyltransferase involved in cell wall biosynthesis
MVHALFPSWLPHRGMVAKAWTPLYPPAWRLLDLRGYDLVISSSSFAAHHVRVDDGCVHVCYCHTPPRFLYGLTTEMDHAGLRRHLPVVAPLYPALRAADRSAARRVTAFVANSLEVQRRIGRYYARPATVIYPPVETALFHAVESVPGGDYFLSWGRLVASKRTDLIVEAATAAALPLVIAGAGPDERRLRGIAGPTVRFVHRPSGPALLRLLAGCRAVVFAAEEDFGIVPVEAMAAGKPVVAFGGGGALESVLPGVTGELFTPQAAEPLRHVLERFDPGRYDSAACRRHAARFDAALFATRMQAVIATVAGQGIASRPPIG